MDAGDDVNEMWRIPNKIAEARQLSSEDCLMGQRNRATRCSSHILRLEMECQRAMSIEVIAASTVIPVLDLQSTTLFLVL